MQMPDISFASPLTEMGIRGMNNDRIAAEERPVRKKVILDGLKKGLVTRAIQLELLKAGLHAPPHTTNAWVRYYRWALKNGIAEEA